MKRSFLIAAAIAGMVGLWLATGFIGEDDPATPSPSLNAGDAGGSPATAVQVMASVAEPHVRRLTLFGRTEADRRVDVKSETDGEVAQKLVDKGARVGKGDVLLRLDLEDREARLREAEAMVEQWDAKARASSSLARSGYAADLKKAEDRAELEGAKARLEEIRLDIDRTAIAAPFAGVVEEVTVEEGDYVDRFETVATVVDLDPIKIVAEVTEQDAGSVETGRSAQVRLVTGETLGGTVTYVARSATPGTRTFEVEVEVDNADGAIPDGITAEVTLPLDEALAHRISPAVLTLDDNGRVGVKVVGENDEVVFRPVKVIDDTPEGMWVAGLSREARIIAIGQEFVRPGQQVAPVAYDGATAAEDRLPADEPADEGATVDGAVAVHGGGSS